MLNLRNRHAAGIVAGIVAAFVLTVACYWPSLDGPFLFDDFPNLETMGERGGLDSLEDFAEFVLNGDSGPLGRPLSLASFAIDAGSWPSDARPFRVMNLAIHLINGLLAFLLARLIFAASFSRETADKLALLCMTLWLVHPLLVSTTAYVIQRMAQLGCLFTLLGLLSYMRGRMILADKPGKGWAWILLGMGAFGLLAILSKETGVLLPFYALAIEVTVFNSAVLAGRQRTVLIALFCMPLLALLAYVTIGWNATIAGFEMRPFSMAERVLTQGVVLMDYLRQILVPQIAGLGLFHDDYPVSKGFLDPASTAISWAAIATLLFLAVRWRRAWPLVSLGVLWFFVGHSLEAGPFALELYFEHRNYLASLGPLIALCSVVPLVSKKLRGFLPLLIVLVVVFESFITWQSAKSWGNEELMMRIAMVEHPDSLRVQQHVSNLYIMHRNYPKALDVQENLALKFPQHTSTRLSILNLRCLLNTLTEEDVAATQEILRHGEFDIQIVGFIGTLLSNASSNTCAALDITVVHDLFDEVLKNPSLAGNKFLRGATHYNKGLAYSYTGDLDSAMEQMNLSYQANPEMDIRMQQVVWMLQERDASAAAHYLALAKQHGQSRLLGRSFRTTELAILQQEVDKLAGERQ